MLATRHHVVRWKLQVKEVFDNPSANWDRGREWEAMSSTHKGPLRLVFIIQLYESHPVLIELPPLQRLPFSL